MTIRETTAIQKKNHRFSLIKYSCFCFGLVFLFAFSNPLLAQQEGVIISSDFESKKPLVNTTVNKVTEVPANKDEQKLLPKQETILVEDEKPSKQTQLNKPIKLLPLVTGKNFAELKQKLTTQQDLLEQLSVQVSELSEQNQALESKVLALQTRVDKQPAAISHPSSEAIKHPKLKAQVINLAIQVSLLKPETLAVKSEKNTDHKDSAWYEKLVVVKKIEKQQQIKQSTTPLYALLKQFDLLQLALETSNQQQWQTTIQSLTTSLQSQYPTNAQEVVRQLNELQTQNIASSSQTDNSQTVDAKFGIK